MKLIGEVIRAEDQSATLSIQGKEAIYFREGASRHLWIGKITKVSMNGVTILYRNGTEQGYSMKYFRAHFCAGWWKANAEVFKCASNLRVNYHGQLRAYNVLEAEPTHQAQLAAECDHAAQISDLGEYYVWRIGGDIPKKIHHTLDDALAEATRLAELHPRCCFKVLNVSATVVSQPITKYDTKVVIH